MADGRYTFALLAAVKYKEQVAHIPLVLDDTEQTVFARKDQAPAVVRFTVVPGANPRDGLALTTEVPAEEEEDASATAPSASGAAPQPAMETWVLAALRSPPSSDPEMFTHVAWVPFDGALEADAPVAPLRFVPPASITAHGTSIQPLMCTSHAINGSHANEVLHLLDPSKKIYKYPVHIIAHRTMCDVQKYNTVPTVVQ